MVENIMKIGKSKISNPKINKRYTGVFKLNIDRIICGKIMGINNV
jgi:hypothetical protein